MSRFLDMIDELSKIDNGMSAPGWTTEVGRDWTNIYSKDGVDIAHSGESYFYDDQGEHRITAAQAEANTAGIASLRNLLPDIVRKLMYCHTTIQKCMEIIDDSLEEKAARHSLGRLYAECKTALQ